jgi:8-oxo-dGTP pyrophosphatase MutT (NUDIX family)
VTTAAELAASLQQRLAQPLPGAAAMRAWSPQLAYGRHFVPPPADARQSAVAILIYPHAGEWYVPLTLRPATLSNHASQVSLPGGALDADESPQEGAWRELAEELGIAREALVPLGRLTPLYIFVSNFYVHPCVALMRDLPTFTPSPGEVEAILEVPLLQLPTSERRDFTWIERGGLRFRAPCWQVGAQRVWGASAMILGELAAIWQGVLDSLEQSN